MHAIYIHTYTSIIIHTSIYVLYTSTAHTCLSFDSTTCLYVHPNTQPRHCVKYPHIEVFILFFAQWGYTALLRAAYEGRAEVVRMLMDCGSTLTEVDNVSVHPAPMSTDSV